MVFVKHKGCRERKKGAIASPENAETTIMGKDHKDKS